MINKLLLILPHIFSFCLFDIKNLFAQNENSALPDLIPYRKGDKWGYCDKNKKIVLPCKYDDAKIFSEGLAAVKKDKMWGYINKKGKEIISYIYYKSADIFCDGLAAVRKV